MERIQTGETGRARTLLSAVTGILCFEAVTGLLIYILPFGVTVQQLVLLHTFASVVAILPYLLS